VVKKSSPQDNTLYIICECAINPDDISTEILNESTVADVNGNKKKTVTIDTTLQSFDVPNWNNRIYGGQLVMDSIDNDGMIQNDIKHGQWIGEYGHPLDPSPKRAMVLYPPTSSHRILNYRREGNLLKGHVQTLVDGMGSMMCERILQGVPAAFSLRSLGSVDMATRRVNAPLKVITYDSVFRPSHIEAYQEEILNESATYIPQSEKMNDILTESTVFCPITESMEDIMSYVKERSDSVKAVAEMFKLDNLSCALTESGERMNIQIDDHTVANVPIESVINIQYSDILNSLTKKGGC
jgi:hypothetical protein